MLDNVKEKELLQIPQDDFLDSFESCRILCDGAVQAHDTYWKLIDVCEEHIRGKKPKDPIKLKKTGMHWANNWNYLKARSKITGIVLENIELVKNAINLAVPEFKRDPDIPYLEDEDTRGTVSMALSKIFYESLEKESSFNRWINDIEYPSTSFGYTPVIFDGEDNWMGDPTHPRNIAFEDKTEPENIRAFVIFKTVKADFLWGKWVDAKNANYRETVDEDSTGQPVDISTTNWSVEGLEAILWKALSGDIKTAQNNGPNYKTWESVSKSILSGDRSITYFIRNTNNVSIAKIFYRELSRKWTETYIPYLNEWQNGGKSDEETGDHIIFKKHHGKKHQDRIINLVTDSPFTEGGYISEFRGIAKYATEDSMRFNRKKNNIEDKLIFSGAPMFEQQNTQSKEAFKITPSQGFTMIKKGFNFIPDQPSFDLSNHLLSIELDERHFLRETKHFDPSLEGKLTSRPVKDEVQAKSREVQAARSSKNSVKFSDWSRLILNVLKNLAEVEAPEEDEYGYSGYNYFYKELEHWLKDKELIDEDAEAKKEIKKLVKSVIAFEIEPAISDRDSVAFALSISETSFARNRLKRMLLLIDGFPRKEIDRIVPLETDSMRNLGDERVAAIENDMFWTTNEVILDPRDDSVDHLNIHYGKFNSTVQAVQQGRLEVIKAFKYLANLMSHAEQHLVILSRDPTLQKAYEQLQNTHNEFIQILSQIKSAAEAEFNRKQKEEQQSIPPEKLKELQLLEFEKVQKQRRTEELTKHKQALTVKEQAHRQALEEQQQAFNQRMEASRLESEKKLDTIREAAKLFN